MTVTTFFYARLYGINKSLEIMELTTSKPSSIFNRGLLNSAYKEDIAYSFSHLKNKSLFNLRERALANHDNLCCSAGTILKLSIFAVALILILF